MLLLVFVIQVKAQPIGPVTTPVTAYLPSEVPDLVDYVLMDTTDPIEPDFPEYQFIKDTCGYLDLGGGCVLEYVYYYRTVGNTFYDLYISSFSFKGTNCHIGESLSPTDEYYLIIDIIMSHIVRYCNPWNISIPPCEENVPVQIHRLGHPACLSAPHWVYDPINNWFFKSVTACKLNTNASQCWHLISYCWKDDNLIHNTLSTGVGFYTCPTFLDGYPNIQCYPICEVGGWGGE